jgi:hypothetical protein
MGVLKTAGVGLAQVDAVCAHAKELVEAVRFLSSGPHGAFRATPPCHKIKNPDLAN